MAAVAEQVFAALLEGEVEFKVSDAAGAALADAVVERDHHHRTVKLIDQARGHDADHARVPVFVGQRDCPAVIAVHLGGDDHFLGLLGDLSFERSPSTVLLFQIESDFPSAVGIGTGQ